MNKRVLIPVLLLAVLLSGCVTIRIETKVKEDGSGTKSFVLALDRSVVSMFDSMAQESGASAADIWDTARVGAESIQGATVEDYSDDENEGIKVTVPFSNFEELQALSGSDAFEGVDVVTVSQSGDTTTLTARLNTAELTSGFDASEAPELEGFDLGEIDFEFVYAVEVEGKIAEYSPTEYAEVTGSKVTWDLTQFPSDTAEVVVRWEPSGGLDLRLIVLIFVALGGAILVAAGIFLAVRDKRTSDQVQMG